MSFIKLSRISGFIILITIPILIVSCSITGPDINDLDPKLLEAPEALTIGNQTIKLDSYLWRDFMPGPTPGGSELIAALEFYVTDSTDFPGQLEPIKLFVILNNQQWETLLVEKQDSGDKYSIIRIARDGPKWGPKINVTVVVSLNDGDQTYLLKQSDVYINRTD